MSVSSFTVLRYRAAGHVRYQLPAEACSPSARRSIEAALRETEGVYRVDFFPRQRKVSIRFIESVIHFDRLGPLVTGMVEDAAVATSTPSCCAAPTGPTSSLPQRSGNRSGPLAWVRARFAGTSAGGAIPAMPWLKESTVVEFLNDALVLFLIKLHWHMITQHWLRQPWRYRYEWLAALYLIYLLVRSRRPKKS